MSGLVEESQTASLVDLVSKIALRLSLALLAISLAGLGNRLEIQLEGDGQGEEAAEPQQACGEQRPVPGVSSAQQPAQHEGADRSAYAEHQQMAVPQLPDGTEQQRTREPGEAEEKRFHLGPPIQRLLSSAHRGAA